MRLFVVNSLPIVEFCIDDQNIWVKAQKARKNLRNRDPFGLEDEGVQESRWAFLNYYTKLHANIFLYDLKGKFWKHDLSANLLWSVNNIRFHNCEYDLPPSTGTEYIGEGSLVLRRGVRGTRRVIDRACITCVCRLVHCFGYAGMMGNPFLVGGQEKW